METNNEYNTKVTNKEIANGVKDEYGCIYSPDGKRLLKGNKDIESYTIKEGTEVICDNAFHAFFECSSLQSIVIPNSVTKIGDNAFNGCSSLQSIVIPNSVTVIGEEAFSNCTSLKSIVIPDSVTEIGDYAFCWCRSLQSIVIPESVTEIGDCAFTLGIELTLHSSKFVVEDDLLINLEKKRLIQCLKDKNAVVIPESVTEIGDGAFYACKSLQSTVIPNSVTKIGNWAFCGCSSLQSIVIPKGKRKYFEGLLERRYHELLKDGSRRINGITDLWSYGIKKIVLRLNAKTSRHRDIY